MNVNQEGRIVRWSIIFMLIGTSIFLMIDYLIATSEKKSDISITSGFGKITIFNPTQANFFNENSLYNDSDLKFQILKPDNTWKIRLASDTFNEEKFNSLQSLGYLDGIYLDKQNNKRFLITVFDISQENFQLSDFVENQIRQMKLVSNIKTPIKQVSPSNDWAIFSMDNGSNVDYSYGEQMLFFKDGRLYMLQYSGNSPENITESDKLDFRFIMNSFEVF